MYCTKDEVKAEFAGISIDNSGTKVLNSDLDAWISQETAYINGKIGLRYIVPVSQTAAEAFLILKRICLFRVSERVKNKLEVKTNVNQLNQEVKYTQNFMRTPNHDLKDIAEGNLILFDVPLVSSTGSASANPGICVDTDSCHFFEIGKDQW